MRERGQVMFKTMALQQPLAPGSAEEKLRLWRLRKMRKGGWIPGHPTSTDYQHHMNLVDDDDDADDEKLQ
jgi:hypothetical protein